MDKYEAQRGDELREMLERPGSAKAALVDFIHMAADCCTSEEGRRGCLAGKAAMELAPHDKDIADWLKKYHRRNIDLVAAHDRPRAAAGRNQVGPRRPRGGATSC